MSAATRWAQVWPPLLAVIVVTAVGAPAAVASYRHARTVVASTGDGVMAPWLPLSVDGMLVAALVVIWVRRRRGQKAGRGPWAAFLFGMTVTIAANLAAVEQPSPTAFAVALFPPLALGITLELVALVAYRPTAQGVSDGPEVAVVGTAVPTEGAGTSRTPAAVVGQRPTTDLDRPGTGAGSGAVRGLSGDGNEKSPPPPGTPAPGTSPVQVGPDAGPIPRGSSGVSEDERAAALIAEGAGRRRLARELGVTEHQARELLAERRNGHEVSR